MSSEISLKDDIFLISETDDKGIITYASNDFCSISQYDIEELVGKPHNILRHNDMPPLLFKELWNVIKSGGIWRGCIKNKTKNGDYYWAFSTIYSKSNVKGEKRFISCKRKAHVDEINRFEKKYLSL